MDSTIVRQIKGMEDDRALLDIVDSFSDYEIQKGHGEVAITVFTARGTEYYFAGHDIRSALRKAEEWANQEGLV